MSVKRVFPNGTVKWYLNKKESGLYGKLHREDGPAVIWADDAYIPETEDKEWFFINGNRITKQEYLQKMSIEAWK